MKTNLKLTDERKEYLDSLASRIDEYAKNADEHVTSSESSTAEFLLGFYYEEARLSDFYFDRLDISDPELGDDLKEFAKKNGMPAFFKLLAPLVSLELVGIHYEHAEILSVSLGECEEQLSDELAKEVLALSKEEQEYVRSEMREACLGNSCPDCIYLNHDYERFVLILDEEKARMALNKFKPKVTIKERKAEIDAYLDECAFRDYSFKPASQFGKYNKARSINLLNPTNAELEDALNTFSRDGFGCIVIYLGKRPAAVPKRFLKLINGE